MKVRKRVTLMVVTISIIFGVCYLTNTSNYLMRYYHPSREFLSRDANSTTIFFNSAINPIVYALVNQRFREKFKRMMCCLRHPSTNMAHPARRAHDQMMELSVGPTHSTQETDESCKEWYLRLDLHLIFVSPDTCSLERGWIVVSVVIVGLEKMLKFLFAIT